MSLLMGDKQINMSPFYNYVHELINTFKIETNLTKLLIF
jgi:hypothetical protein